MRCIFLMVNEHSKQVKGLFRVPGAVGSINDIYGQVCIHGDAYFKSMIPEAYDAHDVCSALKKLIRQLPESLLTNKLLKQFQEITDAKAGKALVDQLPTWNALCLLKLVELCHEICENTKRTMMTPGALAICIGPNLCAKEDMLFFNYTALFTLLIDNKDYIFRDVDLEDSVTDKGQSTTELLGRYMEEVKYVDSASTSKRELSRREIPQDWVGSEVVITRQKARKNVINAEQDNSVAHKPTATQRVMSSDSIPETASCLRASSEDSPEADRHKELLKKESVCDIPTSHRSLPFIKFGPPPDRPLPKQGSRRHLLKNHEEQEHSRSERTRYVEAVPPEDIDSNKVGQEEEKTEEGSVPPGPSRVLSEAQMFALESDNLCQQVEAEIEIVQHLTEDYQQLLSSQDPAPDTLQEDGQSVNEFTSSNHEEITCQQDPAFEDLETISPMQEEHLNELTPMRSFEKRSQVNQIGYLMTPDVSPVRKSSLWHSDVMISFIDIIGQTQMEIMDALRHSDEETIHAVKKIHDEQLKRLDELFKSTKFTMSSQFTVPAHASEQENTPHIPDLLHDDEMKTD
eukprot:TRINITY_DN7753_c0_g1_i1.p1 TRINITY_DN7753_c0_g1~~TRINITY_DN7753_c0_g1_i1.p1  ORF type:complete len:572 (-),score=119.16 TRINITY_DN7753_c0_g1_i1:16-1731(-)